jgi:membrane fusion protein, multidrug efflux system
MCILMSRASLTLKAVVALAILGAMLSLPDAARAADPPAVGVVEVVKRSITETSEYLGRIEAVNRVAIVARVTAYLEKRLYKEGAEVSANDQLYLLERPPFEADLDAKKAQVAQLEATLLNARITAERQRILLNGPAGLQANYDTAVSNQKSLEAQVKAAEAQVRQSQINLDYTDIRSPIDGKIGRTAITEGNVVSPTAGTLTTIVSQDPMYVTFPVSVRQALQLHERYAAKGVRDAVVMVLRLPDGRIYPHTGRLNFESNSISQTTDTLLLRGTIPNPPLSSPNPVRELTDGELVTVMLEGAEPVEIPAIPRAAVLADAQGDYVLVVGADNKVEQRRVQLGQSTTTIASIKNGLSLGEKVIVEGIQRARPGQAVAPGRVSAGVEAVMRQADRDPAPGNTNSAQRAATEPNGGD